MLHRLAPIALSALGIFGALLMIFAGLLALNHTVLPFKGWPLDGERLDTGKQMLPRAPVEAGRLRTAHGGALAGASPLLRGSLPALALTPRTTLTVTTVGGGLRIGRGLPHAAVPKSDRTPAPQQPTAAPQASPPAPAVTTTPAAAPAPAVVTAAPISRSPSTSTASPAHGNGHANGHAKAPAQVAAPAHDAAPAHEAAPANVHGVGRAHAPGQLKKAVAAAVPSPATPAVAPAATPGDDQGDARGNGHGPPPWAHGHH